MDLTKRELEFAGWTAELALEMAADALLEMYTEIMDDWAKTPRWHWLKRRRWMEQADRTVDAYRALKEKANEQGEARERSH